MKCKYCEYDNLQEVKFCGGCGRPLDEDYQDCYERETPVPKGKSKKPYIAVAVVLFLVLIGGIFYIQHRNKIKELKQFAQRLEEEGRYDLALQQYTTLFSDTRDIQYENKMKEMEDYVQEMEIFHQLQESELTEDRLVYLKKLDGFLPKEKELKTKVQEKKLQEVKKLREEVNKLKNFNKTEELSRLLESCGEVSFLRVEANNLLREMEWETSQKEKILAEQKEKMLEEQKEEEKVIEEENILIEKQSLQDQAYALIGTIQYVTSSVANVRSGPGLKYNKVYRLSRGDGVYVYDTRTDDVRVWCNIGDGWISYRTLNGELD